MHILYCFWGENTAPDMIEAFEELGHSVFKFSFEPGNYNNNHELKKRLNQTLFHGEFDCIFSFDFFPLIAEICHENHLNYLSWIYDMPHTTLYSPQAFFETNYIFLFDKTFLQELSLINKQAHLFYLPLAANTKRIQKVKDYHKHNIVFIGSLYETCLFNQISYLPPQLKGYLDAFFENQAGNYFFSLTDEVISASITSQIREWVKLELSDSYRLSSDQLYYELIQKKLSSMDRIKLLDACSRLFPLSLYSASNSTLLPHANFCGYADNHTEMPAIFRDSKISLNISLRTIKSGIPLRCIDIMGAGGFLLSNYQEELNELFEDGNEMVLFYSKEDMLSKIDYYMTHEKERIEIAHNGLSKINAHYTFLHAGEKILNCI